MGKNNNGRFETQSEADVDGPAYVGVDSTGIYRATNTPVASEFIIDGGPGSSHVHIGLDDDGDTLFIAGRQN